MIAMLATVPRMDVPRELRKMAKRARREVAQARAEGVADMVGGRS